MSHLRLTIHDDRAALGRAAADLATRGLLDACGRSGSATLVVATGSSQFEVLTELAAVGAIPWERFTAFHLDEYVGLEPTHAISMSVRRILATGTLVCSVPDRRKAEAVKATVEGPVTPMVPASILQQHPRCFLQVDREAASLLRPCDSLAK